MSYELFRNDVFNKVNLSIPETYMKFFMEIMDSAAQAYEFTKKCMDLSVCHRIPNAVRDYISAKATENLSKGTLRNYFNMLKNFFAVVGKPVNEITTNDIRVYLFNYKERRKISDRTLEQMRVDLNSFFCWCVNEDIIIKNPVRNVSAIRFHETERNVLTPSELEQIRFACKDIREKAIVDTLYSTGCRVTELCAIQLGDIDWENRSIKIHHGKGDKERTVYLNAESAISLRAYLNTRKDFSPYVFTDRRETVKHQLDKKTIEVTINNIVKRSGITKKVTPHCFRHTLATTLLRNGCPIEHVQKMLGHSKISTTMIYARINDEEVKRNHDRYSI